MPFTQVFQAFTSQVMTDWTTLMMAALMALKVEVANPTSVRHIPTIKAIAEFHAPTIQAMVALKAVTMAFFTALKVEVAKLTSECQAATSQAMAAFQAPATIGA